MDERQIRLGAAPLPIDINKALSTMGYRKEDKDRLVAFKEEIRTAIEKGGSPALADALLRIRRLKSIVAQERVEHGVTGTDSEPYLVELWLNPEGAMVGIVLFDRAGFGIAPVEILVRDPANGNRKETEEKLRRQLQSQALIYQSFAKLFSRRNLLAKAARRALPSFVKTLYEPTEPNRLLLLARLRYARELVSLMESFTRQIVESEASDARTTAEGGSVVQILAGLTRKVEELIRAADKSRDPQELARLVKEYERALKYLNIVVIHSVNPWLQYQTADPGTEFEFKKEDVGTNT